MKKRSELVHHLRDHIVGALHVGRLRAGDRLPSIREVAAQSGMNPRTVAAAYRTLEEEGLVALRGRSGVFVAQQETLGDERLEETARWLSGVVAEGWKRRISAAKLPALLRRAVGATRIHCALVEEIEDAIVAFSYEISNDFGFDVEVFAPEALPGKRRGRERAAALEQLRHIDFFAATSFCAPMAHEAAQALGKPLVVLTTHPALQDAIRRHLNQGPLTVVAADARFANRLRVAYDVDDRSAIRLILADDDAALSELDSAEPVLLTRAAREVSTGLRNPVIHPHSPTLSPDTAAALSRIMVLRNLDAGN